jgi:hypothetical protein
VTEQGASLTAAAPSSESTTFDIPAASRPSDLPIVRVFLVALAGLLLGYMFMGRGFAHLGRPPLYVGEIVLLLGLVATGYAIARLRLRIAMSAILWLLVAFMALGLARTVPYLGVYGTDALRDAVLWGYGLFALMVYVLVDRDVMLRAWRGYGWVVPVFALWLPICWNVFRALSVDIDPANPGQYIPLVFFKSGDMAVHTVGAIAFLVLGTGAVATIGSFAWRTLIVVPLAWTAFIAGTSNRGSLLATLAGIGMLVLLSWRSRNWIPVVAGVLLLAIVLAAPGIPGFPGLPTPGASPGAVASPTPVPTGEPTPSTSAEPSPTGSAEPTPSTSAEPTPTPPAGRAPSVVQLFENILSIFSTSASGALEGTKAFRLAWWGTIVDYTVFGPHFWLGKGFGVNLADDDGYQPTADGSLRAPHNSHLTVLARMGVPGFILWVLLQGAFAIGLVRSVLANRRAGDARLAALGGWIFVVWTAMMVNTSFDPYLEGPQGGIWFWTLFGAGLVVMRLTPRRRET